MAKFESVADKFKKIKEALKTEKEEKPDYSNPFVFKPVLEKGSESTKYRIRFLPVSESKIGKPWVELEYHMFERDGDQKFQKCLNPRSKYFGKVSNDVKNPISELGTKLWNSDNVLDKEKAKKYFNKKRYLVKVLIKEAPEKQKDLEGKVLFFEAGDKIFQKLDSAINDFDKCFWDPFKGEDFILIVKSTGGERPWPDYTQSSWIGEKSPISESESEMDRIASDLEKLSLKEHIIDKDLRSYAEMEEMIWGGLKKEVVKNSQPTDLTKVATKEEDVKPVVTTVKKELDVGDKNITPSSKPQTQEKESESGIEEVMDFNVDISDLDVKF